MKNVDELYLKYYNAYKSYYDTDGELNEAKKKHVNHKQFEFLDKTDKESKLDEKTKQIIKEIKEREEGVDKKGFSKYFGCEPSAIVSKLYTQDLKKGLDKIKN